MRVKRRQAPQFLAWRYSTQPGHRYRIRRIRARGSLEAETFQGAPRRPEHDRSLALQEGSIPSMYLPLFGTSAQAFQLSPDPTFYFDSRSRRETHRRFNEALDAGTAVLVLSGDIGAGKTMLLREAFSRLQAPGTVIASVVSSQLDSSELLQIALMGFGCRPSDLSPVGLRQAFGGFLTSLGRAGRRALLAIDEAQNLAQDAFVLLGELIGEARTRGVPLQVCLTGQLELAALMQSTHAQVLRNGAIVLCHLGPLDADEIRDYIQHRLTRAGCIDQPRFSGPALEAIHRWTQGVPRKINLLCNLLLVHDEQPPNASIDPEMVEAATRKLDGGIDSGQSVDEFPTNLAPILCIAGGLSDYIKAAAVLRELTRQSLHPVKLVSTYAGDFLLHNLMLFDSIDSARDVIALNVPTNDSHSPALRDSLLRTLRKTRPAAVVVFDGSTVAFTAAALAKRENVRVLHVGGGVRDPGSLVIGTDTAKLTDALADIVYACDPDAVHQLFEEGFDEDHIVCIGSLLADTFSNTPAQHDVATSPGGIDLSFLSAAPFENGYALVQLNQHANTDSRETLIQLMSILRHVSKELPLVWPVGLRVAQRLESIQSMIQLDRDRVVYLDELPYAQFADLLCNAVCVVTDSWNLQEEATTVGIPCITIGTVLERGVTSNVGSNASTGMDSRAAIRAVWDCMFNGAKSATIPASWDGNAASRLAGHLLPWLATPKG